MAAAWAEVFADWLWGAGASAVVESTGADDSVVLLCDLPGPVARALAATGPGGAPGDQRDSGASRSRSDGVPADSLVGDVPGGLLQCRIVGDAALDRAAGRTWQQYLEPERCGRFLIVPAWHDQSSRGDDGGDGADGGDGGDHAAGDDPVTLVMDPGDAFGAGTHVTTRLCLEVLPELVRGGERVLDFGCGTGILGVAAVLLGAAQVVALDIDSEAVRVTEQVAGLNGVSAAVRASSARLEEVPGGFDLILANVLIGVLEEHGPTLARRLAPGGHVVVSGVLEGQRSRAALAFEPLQVVAESRNDDWLRLTLCHATREVPSDGLD